MRKKSYDRRPGRFHLYGFFVKVGSVKASCHIFSFHVSVTSLVTNHPTRYYGTNDLHFINCSCYHRQPWLDTPQRRDLFLIVLEEVRQRYRFVVVGYVVMPDHIHLLISEPERGDPSRVIQAIKQGFARRVLKTLRRRRVAAQAELFTVAAEHVWQKRFYDFNVFTARKRIEKLR